MSAATPLERGEALRVLHSTCRLNKLAMPVDREAAIDALVTIAGLLPPSRAERAEACLLLAAEFRADAQQDFDARR